MTIIKAVEEDFSNYKLPSMFIAMPYCTFKCDIENKCRCCQNSGLAQAQTIHAIPDQLILHYLDNPITSAIVFGGLEPFDSFDDVHQFIKLLRERYHCNDTIVIYTGYNKDEIEDKIEILKKFGNIICKFGRFVPGQEKHFDEVLGVQLASRNQYAERIC